jgi:hypothetical protein
MQGMDDNFAQLDSAIKELRIVIAIGRCPACPFACNMLLLLFQGPGAISLGGRKAGDFVS